MFIYLDFIQTARIISVCAHCTHYFRPFDGWLLAFDTVVGVDVAAATADIFLYCFLFDSINHAHNDVEIPNRVCRTRWK